MRVLVLGASGYVGGRLVPELLAAGHQVRCAVRDPRKLASREWREAVDVVAADVLEQSSLVQACDGMDVVYFLVHSMDGASQFEQREQRGAEHVREAARAAGVSRIIYLGGLGKEEDRLSAHLRSRHNVGEVLATGPVPVTELRAGIIIGSGSASFEMLRHLVEKLPVMVTPRWVDTRTQPIAIRDVLRYLVGVLDSAATAGRVLEIGGRDVVTYRDMLRTYARLAGLRRRVIVPVPALTPRLSSLWMGLVTPLPVGVARPLIDSLVNEVVADDETIRDLVPFEPMSLDEAITAAIRRVQNLDVATTWANAGGSEAAAPLPDDPAWAGGTLLSDVRRVTTSVPPEVVFAVVVGIGGGHGWYSARVLWGVRGALDKLVGGIGLRRGRRHPTEVAVGDVIDFWRVDEVDPPLLLRLRAEMKLPGAAWLEFAIVRGDHGETVLTQRAMFSPRGLAGRIYWYGLSPFHWLIFPRMARHIVAAAESGSNEALGR